MHRHPPSPTAGHPQTPCDAVRVESLLVLLRRYAKADAAIQWHGIKLDIEALAIGVRPGCADFRPVALLAIIRPERRLLYYAALSEAQRTGGVARLENVLCEGILLGCRIMERP
jgi:hypothetical protein